MSSKKSSLTYEASLGACLSFAGQVLSSSLPPNQVCTKDVLSPIVVEAHRFGQQVSKSCGSVAVDKGVSSAAVDPRRLLRKLQACQSEPEWSRPGVQVERLVFEDLTWDSQGDVAQTLEMELLELETRAVEANISVCVLLMLRTTADEPKSIPETAILWLPLDNHHQGSNNGKKQYLLYACPGRIKVMKSAVELFRKMREEIKLMSASDAVYNVWTLSRSLNPQVKKKVGTSNQHREYAKPQVQTPRNSAHTPEKVRALVDTPSEKHKGPETDEERKSLRLEEEQLPQPHRVKSMQPVQIEGRLLPKSIFIFTTEPSMRNPAEQVAERTMITLGQQHETLDIESPASSLETLERSREHALGPVKQENEALQPPKIIRSSRKQIVSSSYSDSLPTRVKNELNQGSMREEKRVTVWQSLDSDLKMSRLVPKEPKLTQEGDDNNGEKLSVATEAHEAESCSASRSSPDGNARVDASLECPQLTPRSLATVKGATSIFTFLQEPSTTGLSSRLSPQANCASSPPSRESWNAQISESSEQDHMVDLHDDRVFPRSADKDAADQALEGTTTPSREAEDAAADAEDVHINRQKPTPARKNFRSKLGNRVWYELQCAAEQLLQQQQSIESAKRGKHPEVHTMSKKNCSSSKVRAERKGTTTRSPFEKESPAPQRHTDQQASNQSEDNTSICEVRCLPHPASPKSTAATTVNCAVPKSLPETLQLSQYEADSMQLTSSVSASTKRVFLPQRAAESAPSHISQAEFAVEAIAMAETETPRVTTKFSTSRSSVCQSTSRGTDVDSLHTPLFAKTALFSQEPAPASSRTFKLARASNEDTSPQCARSEAPSQNDAEATASKNGSPLRYTASSKPSVLRPRDYDYDDEDHPTDSTIWTAPQKSHAKPSLSKPKWYSDARDSMTFHDDDDEDHVQNQWASTRTSYAVEREPRHAIEHRDGQGQQSFAYDLPSARSSQRQPAEKAPFNVRGRVPIRSNRDAPLSRQKPKLEDGASLSDEEEFTQSGPVKNQSQAAGLDGQAKKEKDEEEDVFRPRKAETAKAQAAAATVDRRTHVATFIAIDVDSAKASSSSSKRAAPHSSTASSAKLQSRAEKLAELRQKKLQQLHKAREEQQQKRNLLKTKSNLAAQAVLDYDNTSSINASSPGTTITANSHLRAAKKLSNKKLIQNALEYTLLAGFSMEKERSAALAALAQSHCENFIVLLKSTKDLKFRALYEHHTDRQEVVKLFASRPGVPMLLTGDVIGQFFKYNSGKKEFVAIDSRSFTMITDACALRDELVFKKKTTLSKLL